MIKFLKISFLLFSMISLAQTNPEKILNGKVIADYGDLNGIYVINLNPEASGQKVSITEKGGFFNFPASVGDTLMFSSINYKGLKIKLKEEDLQKSLFFVKLHPIMNQLKEVVIVKFKHINAQDMGIIPRGQKTFTPAERKLNTASNPYMAFKSGLSFSAYPLLNALSGRTAMLEKIVEVEKKEISIAKTEDLFDENYFVEKLKIPLEFIKGFQFFIVEDEGYSKAIKAKNKTLAQFRMGELALNYLDLISEKKF
jgi:hypothetical protein